jgi:hypothetical protein
MNLSSPSFWKPLAILLSVVSASLAVVVLFSRLSTLISGPPSEEEIEPPYQSVQISGPVRPITDVPTNSVKQAWDALQPDELVLGVAIGNQARAYPLNLLKDQIQNEVLNDLLAGEPIVVTFCSFCHNGVVYSRIVDDQILSFCLSGRLWEKSMILNDQETETQWSQLSGKAKAGLLVGKSLRPIPSVVVAWKAWRQAYPAGTVAALDYSSKNFSKGYNLTWDRFVLGIASEKRSKAWSLDNLAQAHIVHDEWVGQPVIVFFQPETGMTRLFARMAHDKELTFHMVEDKLVDDQTNSTWEPLTGKALAGPLAGQELTAFPAVVVYRKAWQIFHPTGIIY